ncbi:hypothetical protein RIF29_06105 [Crotalaria pallida]|uniref:NB-ARC domain-containing protein n=1 Tax=Crotalaria pallida TaxID=3830 RepID=A0AAN9J2Y2_CROPI
MDDNNYITGLQGMGGTGKTTLATQVGKELQKLKFFDHVVDTTVSYTPKIETIQDDIAGPLGLQLKNYNESERPKQLWSRLRNNEEKILVILDDVWGPIDFEKIGIPSEGDHNGCRVLLTTRYVHVCNSMGCERGKIIQLDLLSDEDSWTLFQKHAGISDHPPKHLLQKGREIVKECQGLPVAIAAIASTLKGQQSREKWDVTLKSLKKPMPMHGVDKDMTRFYKCLRYAYDDMKDEKTKELFLLCSVFHEDEEISTEILTRYSVAMGIFGEVEDKYDDFRSQVVVAKNELVDSCLLLKNAVGSAKMHDLVREAAQWIANNKIQVVKLFNNYHLKERRILDICHAKERAWISFLATLTLPSLRF